jgi:hypothetical protein
VKAVRPHPAVADDFESRMRLYPLAKGKQPKGDSIEELTGISYDTLRLEVKAGRLVTTRVRGRVMVRGENLATWLRLCEEPRQRRHGTSTPGRAPQLAEFRGIRDQVLRQEQDGRL